MHAECVCFALPVEQTTSGEPWVSLGYDDSVLDPRSSEPARLQLWPRTKDDAAAVALAATMTFRLCPSTPGGVICDAWHVHAAPELTSKRVCTCSHRIHFNTAALLLTSRFRDRDRSRPLERERPFRLTSFCAVKQAAGGCICEMVAAGCWRALEALQGSPEVGGGVRSNESLSSASSRHTPPTCRVHCWRYTSSFSLGALGLHPAKHRSQ